jgi:hypothetical protein
MQSFAKLAPTLRSLELTSQDRCRTDSGSIPSNIDLLKRSDDAFSLATPQREAHDE